MILNISNAKKMTKILIGIVLVFGCIQTTNAQQFDQLTRPVATLSDSTQIHDMLDMLLIPAIGRVDRADIVDVTANGFGPNDLVVLYPSMETYEIGNDVPRLLQESMKSWEIAADYRLDATRKEGINLVSDTQLSEDARAALTVDVLGAVSRYYDGDEFELRMSQDVEGVRLEIWNYDPTALHHHPPAMHTPIDTLWQIFRFATPAVVMSFRDASDCIETYANESRVHVRPCD